MSQQKKKRVLFRADGNNEIGLGHVYRSLATAERLAESFDCYFAIRNPAPELSRMIGNTCIPISLDDFESREAEAVSIATSIVPAINADIVTLDGYEFDTAYQSAIKHHCTATLISIDDDQPFHYTADIVINHAAGISPDAISKEPYTRLCLGYDYLMLRKEFLQDPTGGVPATKSSLLVCFGGADPQDHTGQTVSCLLKEKPVDAITVILGGAYEHLPKLMEAVSGDDRVNLKKNLDAREMASLMQETQLSIVPASTIALEAFSMGLTLVTGMTAANQQNIYSGLLKEKSVYGVGEFSTLTCSGLISAVGNALVKYKEQASTPKQRNKDGLLNLYNSI